MAIPPEKGPRPGATPDGGLPPTHEPMEQLRFRGKRALVLGATSGIGRAIAELFVEGGADEVHIGSRSEEGAQATIGGLESKRAFEGQYFGAFPANFNEVEAVIKEAQRLVTERHIPNIIFMGPAVGVNLIQEQLQDALTSIRHERTQEGKDKLRDQLREELKKEVAKPENIEAARRVNVIAYEVLFENLMPYLKPGTIIINMPSTASAKKPGKNVFYELVEETKHEEQENLDQQAPQLAKRGIYVVNIIPHAVGDTLTGRFINVMILTFIADRQRQKEMRAWSVNTPDVVRVVDRVVRSDPTKWPRHPETIYVIGSGDPENPGVQYLSDLPDDHPTLTEELL